MTLLFVPRPNGRQQLKRECHTYDAHTIRIDLMFYSTIDPWLPLRLGLPCSGPFETLGVQQCRLLPILYKPLPTPIFHLGP